MSTPHFRTCPLCDAMCGLTVTVDAGRVRDIRGDPDDVFSKGHICPKGPALRDLHDDPDRLRMPMRRTANGWTPVPWDDALDEASERIGAIRSAHGDRAIGIYAGNPIVHNHTALLALPALLAALGTKNRFDANSQDANPKIYACMRMFGDGLSLTIPDVDRTSYMLILGANPAASNGSTMSLGDVKGRLRGIRERGGKMVLFDPRRTESASWCDEHHFLRPGGDAALVLAMLHVIFADGHVDATALERRTTGAARLRVLASEFPPARVGAAVGIEPETIARIAREFAAAPAAVAYARVGTCQNEFGLVASWLVEALNVVTGNFDRAGGMMFARPAIDIGPVARRLIGNHVGRWRSRVRGLPEFLGALPSAVIAEEIREPGAEKIRAFVTYAGNPVLSTPGGDRLASAFASLEYMVSVDYYLNETTRHANLVLPPVSPLERGHFDLAFQSVAVRNVVKYSEAIFPRPDGARDDGEILLGLATRIAAHRAAPRGMARTVHRAIARAVPSFDRILDVLLRLGPYDLDLARVRGAQHGIDLGPLLPAGRARVRTSDGRVALAPKELVDDVSRVRTWLDARDPTQLVLIGRRHLRSNNSWMHNCASLVKGPSRSALMIHPRDASRLGLGATARVRSRAGEITVAVVQTEEIMQGVVSLPHGYGHGASRDTQRVAGPLVGENVNAVTDAQWVDPVLGNSILNGVPVSVEPV